MNQKILQIGKKITPSFALPFVRKCLQKWKNILERKQLKEIQTYYTLHKPDEETKEILEYLPVCGLRPFPYEWAEMDKADSIEVYFDEERGLHYVLLEGKRLYYGGGCNSSQLLFCTNGRAKQAVAPPVPDT